MEKDRIHFTSAGAKADPEKVKARREAAEKTRQEAEKAETDQIEQGARVIVSTLANPHGPGTVIRADEWTVTVKLDSDGIDRLYGRSVIEREPA